MSTNYVPRLNIVIMEKTENSESKSFQIQENPGNVPTLEYKIGQEPDQVTFTVAGKKWLQRRTSKQLILGTAILILLMISIIVITITLLTKYSPAEHNRNVYGETEPVGNQPDNDPEDPDKLIEMIPKWVKRSMWLATPPVPGVAPLKTPVPIVVLHHTATDDCFTLTDCKAQVQYLQKFHMKSQKWSDIAYNFLVGGDGYIYEGRGWTNMGSHVKGYNNISIGIAFIGLFDDHLPPNKTIRAAQEVIRVGVELKYIQEDYQLIAMRQLSTFKSPGQKLYENIKTWPHWSATLKNNE